MTEQSAGDQRWSFFWEKCWLWKTSWRGNIPETHLRMKIDKNCQTTALSCQVKNTFNRHSLGCQVEHRDWSLKKSRETERQSEWSVGSERSRKRGMKKDIKKRWRSMPKPGWREGSTVSSTSSERALLVGSWQESLSHFSDWMDMWHSAANQGRWYLEMEITGEWYWTEIDGCTIL